MTTRVSTDAAQASSGTVTLSSMSITGSVRKAVASVAAGSTFTMDAVTLGGVTMTESASGLVAAANSFQRAFYLDEADFPGGSTADLVLNTSLSDQNPHGAGGIYTGVASGAADSEGTDADNNDDQWTVSATPSGTGGLAVSFAGRQVQGGDSGTATGDLAIQQEVLTAFWHGITMLDELDPPASSRDGSGDYGTNFRDTTAIMLAFSEGAGGGGGAAFFVPSILQSMRNHGFA